MKTDLHIHTHYSGDGESSPKEIIQRATQKGLGCIAITDHNTIQGAKEACLAGNNENILVIPGIEITTKHGHILGLNLKSDIPKGLSAEETIARIREQNGIAIVPHPFHPLTNYKKLIEISAKIDGIEAFNAITTDKRNQKAAAFVRDNQLAISAGSDAHRENFVGKAFIETKKNKNFSQLAEKIKNKEVKIGGEKPTLKEKKREQVRMGITKAKDTLNSFKQPIKIQRPTKTRL